MAIHYLHTIQNAYSHLPTLGTAGSLVQGGHHGSPFYLTNPSMNYYRASATPPRGASRVLAGRSFVHLG